MRSPQNVTRFLGLNNQTDPLRLKFNWLQKADNINITDTGAIERREGYSLTIPGNISTAYATEDTSRMYMIVAGVLVQVTADMTATPLIAGLGLETAYWCEVNDQVFFSNGEYSGIITAAGDVLDWDWPIVPEVDLSTTSGDLPAGLYQVACTYTLPDGRETGAGMSASIYLNGMTGLAVHNIPHVDGYTTNVYIAPANSTVFQLAAVGAGTSFAWNESPDQLGAELTTQYLSPLPRGCEYIAAWAGRLYASQYLQSEGMSIIWASEPLGFHLFDLGAGFFAIPGRVTMLAPHDDGLIIGTEDLVYVYTGEALAQVADYGVVPGWGWARDQDSRDVLFWSKRGLCKALPFSNVTARQISVDCGLSAGAAIVNKNGAKRYVVALQKGGTNFNERG